MYLVKYIPMKRVKCCDKIYESVLVNGQMRIRFTVALQLIARPDN
jgi:hypothetical protein